LYEHNGELFGDQRRTQEPINSVKSSLIYNFWRDMWIALSGTYYAGVRTSINGVRDLQENTRIGAILSIPITRTQSLKLVVSSGVTTRNGSDFDSDSLVRQHRWGGD
jgi:hypothetical protein